MLHSIIVLSPNGTLSAGVIVPAKGGTMLSANVVKLLAIILAKDDLASVATVAGAGRPALGWQITRKAPSTRLYKL
jgi:hypothetical protein